MKITVFRLVLVLSVALVLNVQMMLTSDAFAILNLSSNEAGLKTVCLESGNDDATSSNLGYVMLDSTIARLPCDLAVPYVYYGIHYFPENSSYAFVRWETSSGIVIEDPSSRETVVVVNKSGIIRAVFAGPSPARVRGQEIKVGEHIFSTHNTSVGFVFNAQISFFNWSYPWIYSYQLKLWYDNALLEAINASIPEDHFLKPKLDPSNIIIIDPGTIDQNAGYVSFAASL